MPIGAPGPGNTLGRGSYAEEPLGEQEYTWERLVRSPSARFRILLGENIARNVAGIARNNTRNIHQTYWDLLGI